MGKPQALNEWVAISRQRRGVYHLLLYPDGGAGRSEVSARVTYILRGELKQVTPEGVVALVRAMPEKPGVFWREGPHECEPGLTYEQTARLPPGETADLLAKAFAEWGVETKHAETVFAEGRMT